MEKIDATEPTSVTFDELRQQLQEALATWYPSAELNHIARIYFEDRFNVKGKNFDSKVIRADLSLFQEDLERLLNMEPVQYVVEKAFFYEYFFKVTPAVLIPRPETEELVEFLIKRIRINAIVDHVKVLDIGTGSGCIAISVKKQNENLEVFALDQSKDALEVAELNALDLEADISVVEMDFLDQDKWDILPFVQFIVSNPPYIAENERQKMAMHVTRFEPWKALFVPDADPLLFYRQIFEFSRQKLVLGGEIVAEISEFQSENLKELCRNYPELSCKMYPDLQGKPRIMHAIKMKI